ncbi:FecR family protein [Larkinella bovis]|uniref:FecR family protein n=1 Tax=Larkinella bovis TaxID=683041 RepID=A0ABW0I7H3_9BACT
MFEKYATYGLEDFVQDGEFIRWVKYPDLENNLFWSLLLETYPFQQETVHQARQVVLKLQEASHISLGDDDAREIWNTLQHSINKPVRVLPLWERTWIKMAAAIIVLIGGLSVWQLRKEETNLLAISKIMYGVLSGDLTVVSNSEADSLAITLPDNSRITLARGARIRYKTSFGDSVREVYLTGEAFFEVARDPQKPFVVYTNKLITRVLGTSFRIKTDAETNNVAVSVRTGKVLVKALSVDQPVGLILLPNQKANFKTDSKILSRTLVDEPVPIRAEGELQLPAFRNIPVAELFDNLEKVYGIPIQFDRDLLTGCRLTTSFRNESLFQRLDILCEAINATYRIEETKIVIEAHRCL